MPSLTAPLALLAGLALVIVECEDGHAPRPAATIGDAEAGAALIREIGCGSCHQIPGIRTADGLVGPPLDHMSRRVYIAGLLQNTPENMVTWLRNPQDIVPGNAMPDTGLSEEQARDVTAYLYTLE